MGDCNASKFEIIVRRFDEMARVREDAALVKRINRREGEEFTTIQSLESAANAYRRCAEEVRRVINGETPAEPGKRWE